MNSHQQEKARMWNGEKRALGSLLNSFGIIELISRFHGWLSEENENFLIFPFHTTFKPYNNTHESLAVGFIIYFEATLLLSLNNEKVEIDIWISEYLEQPPGTRSDKFGSFSDFSPLAL